MSDHARDAGMVKVEIRLSSLAAAACTGSVGIAVWKLVLSPAPEEATDEAVPAPTIEQRTDPRAQDEDADKTPNFTEQDVMVIQAPDTKTPNENQETTPECPKVGKRREWKVGGSRECLLRSMADKATPADGHDWDSASDTTEWSSLADDDEYRQVFGTPIRPVSSAKRAAQWVHVGYGRYTKAA